MSNKTYVQYGCGLCAPESWINYDASPTLLIQKIPLLGTVILSGRDRFPENIRYGNIVKGLSLPPSSCDGIYASHVLEHLSLEDFRTALKNTFHLLKPGGIFRLVVPDLEIAINNYTRSDNSDAAIHFMQQTSLGLESQKHGIEGFLRSWLGHSRHLWMWDYKGLYSELDNAGFDLIKRCYFGDCSDTEFNNVEEQERFMDAVAVESRKPV